MYFSQKWTIEFFFNICFSVCLFSWNLLCDCSFDILTFSRDSRRLSVWCLWFVGLMWLLSWWLTWIIWRLWCIVSILSLGVRLEVDDWEFWFLFSIWACLSSDSESDVYNLLFQDLFSPSRLLFWNKHWSLVIYFMISLHIDSGLNIFSPNSCLLRKLQLLYGVLLSFLLVSYLYLFVYMLGFINESWGKF